MNAMVMGYEAPSAIDMLGRAVDRTAAAFARNPSVETFAQMRNAREAYAEALLAA